MNESAKACAEALCEAFNRYNFDFRHITQRAPARFIQRDWRGGQADAVERIELYDQSVQRMLAWVRDHYEPWLQDHEFWRQCKQHYSEIIRAYLDSEFFKTFFSSITRRLHKIVGVDPDLEFIALDVVPTEDITKPVASQLYLHRGDSKQMFADLFAEVPHEFPFKKFSETVRFVAQEVDSHCSNIRSVQILKPVFFQITHAYLVGSMSGDDWQRPLVIVLRNTEDGVVADAVVMTEREVRGMFSFTRSYFHADLETVGNAVVFLKAIMPDKPIAELYTVLGRAKQGKTERYRDFFNHLDNTQDKFVTAPGDRGMVMLVFTLPSYDIVFKVIRDRFAEPKDVVRQDVLDKYQLVFKHDRAGRLIDAQEFRFLKFDKDRFEAGLLTELLEECADTVALDGDQIIIRHMYIERRLVPLNLYLQQETPELARAAILDYGQAIRDLAMTNIFPGDLLLKNFGVTRNKRVIFYDYDELCFVTDCKFRDMPVPRDIEDEMRADAWFYVGEHDVFPEQFIAFLAMGAELKELFLRVHSDVLSAAYWRRIQQRLQAGELLEVVPFTRRA